MVIIPKGKTIELSPIDTDIKGSKEGYLYQEIENWEIDGWLTHDDYCWAIHPDGTFSYSYDSESERFFCDEDGTFDSSKYEDFVNQMKNHETDWKDELFYDMSTSGGDMG